MAIGTTIRFLGDIRIVKEEYLVYRGASECKTDADLEALRNFGPHYYSELAGYTPSGQCCRICQAHPAIDVIGRCGADMVNVEVEFMTKTIRKNLERLLLLETNSDCEVH